MISVSIITIGNEIVKGRTVNTNASEIAQAFTKVGFRVVRHTSIPDECDVIAETLSDSFRTYDITITTGGLGPTFDDITVECFSKGIGKKLVLNTEAEQIIRDKYQTLKLPLTQERLKMAYFPEGSRIIRNNVGTAPGLFLTVDSHKIFGLPGVPREMRDMLPEVISLCGKSGLAYKSIEFEIEGIMESEIAPFVKTIMKKYENTIYIKTHPVSDELTYPKLIVELYSIAEANIDFTPSMEDIKASIKKWGTEKKESSKKKS